MIISRGIRSWPMLKCSSERCVCAPHSLSAGTSTTPRLSVSLRTSVIASLSQIKQIRTDPLKCDTEGVPDHGVDEPQQWLLPGGLWAHCCNHHYDGSCYSRCHDVVAPALYRHYQRADAEQCCQAHRRKWENQKVRQAQCKADAGCDKPRYSRRQGTRTSVPEDENNGNDSPHSSQEGCGLIDKRRE